MLPNSQWGVQTTANVFLNSQGLNPYMSQHGSCIESLASVVDNLKSHLDVALRRMHSESQGPYPDHGACSRVVATQPMENPKGHYAFTIGGLNPQLKEHTIKTIREQSFGKFVNDNVIYGEDSISATVYINVLLFKAESVDLVKRVHEDYKKTWNSQNGSSITNENSESEKSSDYSDDFSDEESDSIVTRKDRKKHSKTTTIAQIKKFLTAGFVQGCVFFLVSGLLAYFCRFFLTTEQNE